MLLYLVRKLFLLLLAHGSNRRFFSFRLISFPPLSPGVGGFGSVYRCKFMDGSICSIKLVGRRRISKVEYILCGKVVGSVIAHLMVLTTFAFFTTDQCHAYVMEFLEGIDMAKVIYRCWL